MSVRKVQTKCLAFFFLLMLGLLCAEVQGAENPRIHESFVVNSQTELLLYFSVDGAISPDMKQGILTGIPVTFAFFVELHEQQAGKGLVQVANRNFTHTLHFETLKETFSLELTEHRKESFTFNDFNSAARALTAVHDLSVANLTFLKPDRQYTVKMKAQLAKQGLPEKFKNVMTFLKIWYFETKFGEIQFAMPPVKSLEK